MDETLSRGPDYSLSQLLLDDQRSAERFTPPKDLVDVICKDGHIITVHKVLLGAQSSLLKEIFQESTQGTMPFFITLDDFDVTFVEKFCRLMYQGYTVISDAEKEDVEKLAKYLHLEKPKMSDLTQDEILRSTELRVTRKENSRIPLSEINDVQSLGSSAHGANRDQSPKQQPGGKATKRKSRKTRNEQSILSGSGSNNMLRGGNSNKKIQSTVPVPDSSSDESGSKMVLEKRRRTGKYEQACNEEFAPEWLSAEESNTNENEDCPTVSSESNGIAQPPRTRIRTRNRSSQSQSESKGMQEGRTRRPSTRTQTQTRPGPGAVRYAFGSCPADTEVTEDSKCYFCACSFSETGLMNHLKDPRVQCGNHLAGQFSFDSQQKSCDRCKQSLTGMTNWGYIRHLHLCRRKSTDTTLQSDSVTINPDGDSIGNQVLPQEPDVIQPETQPETGNRRNSEPGQSEQLNIPNKTIASHVPLQDEESDSDLSNISNEKFEVQEIYPTLKKPPLTVEKAVELRAEAREKEAERIRRLKENPIAPPLANEDHPESGSAKTEYVVKRRPGGPGPASKTGRLKCLKMTIIRKPSTDEQNHSRNIVNEMETASEATQLIQPRQAVTPSTSTPAAIASDVTSTTLTDLQRGKIRELFRCSVCYDNFDNVHNATKCRWNKGMQLCWICRQLFVTGPKSGTFEQFEYCNPRFRSHCTTAEHTFMLEGVTVVSCPYCNELVPVEAVHEHIESIHVRDFEIDKEIKKASKTKGHTSAVVDQEPGIQGELLDDHHPIEESSSANLAGRPEVDSTIANSTLLVSSDAPSKPTDKPISSTNTLAEPNEEAVNKFSTAEATITCHQSTSASPSRASEQREQPKRTYTNTELRSVIDKVVQEIREGHHNATKERIHKSVCADLEKQHRLKVPRATEVDKPNAYETVDLKTIITLLDEMVKDGTLKYSETRNAYKRSCHIEEPQVVNDKNNKKLRRLVQRALSELSDLDSSCEGFDVEAIENHITHAFSKNLSMYGSGATLRKEMTRALQAEIEDENVELVHGNLYRCIKDSETMEIEQELVFASDQLSVVANADKTPVVQSVSSPALKVTAPTELKQPQISTSMRQPEVQIISKIQRTEAGPVKFSPTQVTDISANRSPAETTMLLKPAEKPTPSVVQSPLLVGKNLPLPPPATTTTASTILQNVPQLARNANYVQVKSHIPPEQGTVVAANNPSDTTAAVANRREDTGQENKETGKRAQSAGAVASPPAGRIDSTLTAAVNRQNCQPGIATTQTEAAKTNSTDEERSNRSRKVAAKMFKALTKPVRPATTIANSPRRHEVNKDVPDIPTIEPEPTESPETETLVQNGPTRERAESPDLMPSMVVTHDSTGNSARCTECNMEYEDADAAAYHICI